MIKLVFIHGWGLDTTFWDQLCAQLPDFEKRRIDLGFFGEKPTPIESAGNILVGHSLGFVHGLTQKQDWRGWIAINSFPRFIEKDGKPGCVPPAALREIRARLQSDPHRTLQDFYAFAGLYGPEGTPDYDRLRRGLDELRDGDIGDSAAKLPGLILTSTNDVLVPEAISQELAEGKKHAMIETGGHALPQVEPTFCANQMRAFLKQSFDWS